MATNGIFPNDEVGLCSSRWVLVGKKLAHMVLLVSKIPEKTPEKEMDNAICLFANFISRKINMQHNNKKGAPRDC